ncbi:MAG: DUF5663 domain-containing protein [Candidatus Nomurabacteria bacterium]|jgi:hypothetical protein|nr:DUF5663 domain-containing protein [Candidatus Nomurabacteria bacterium]
MFQLDNSFLESVGLGGMDSSKKEAFLRHTQEELEVRVGTRMSESMSEEQLVEFEKIIDGDKELISKVIGDTDLKNDKVYKLLVSKAGFKDGGSEIRNEWASIAWLTKNQPNYQQLVKDEISKLKEEIRENRDQIL